MTPGERLIEILAPSGVLIMALIEFYADASTQNGLLVVGAYLFDTDKAKELEREWWPPVRALGLPYFHMGNCAIGAKEFKHLDGPVRDQLQRELIPLLASKAACGFTVSFEERHANLLPSSKSLQIKKVNPYSFCGYWLLHNARRWVNENRPGSRIAYFFERGDPGQGQLNSIIGSVFNDEWHKEHFRIASFGTLDKRLSAVVQTADVIAWQWAKNRKDHGKRPARKDLMVLLNAIPHFTTHFDRRRLLELNALLRRVDPATALTSEASSHPAGREGAGSA